MNDLQVKSSISLFKAYVVENVDKEKYELDPEALKAGVLIDKNAPEKYKKIAIQILGVNGTILNQTFHKSFEKVVNTPIEELIIEQILHYFTTYDFEELGIFNHEHVYIPKEKLEVPEIEDGLKLANVIALTEEEFKDRLWKFCTSGIAFSSRTLDNIMPLSRYLDLNKDNIVQITNKELNCRLCIKMNILPEKPEDFMRVLIYKITGKTLLIKDKETIYRCNTCNKKAILELLNNYIKQHGIERLAQIFNRYKKIFVGLKFSNSYIAKNIELNTLINKLSHLSKKYHKPMQISDTERFSDFLDEIQDKENYEELLKSKLDRVTIWKIIKLRNYLSYKQENYSEHIFKIRNSKVWIEKIKVNSTKDYSKVLEILDEYIVNKLKTSVNSKTILIPQELELALPDSEKQFAGNIPFGSKINLEKDNLIVGIHWTNKEYEKEINGKTEKFDYRIDLDLKVSSKSFTIGWDSDYNEDSLAIFSGDMTDAPLPDGATECIYLDNKLENSVASIKINNYTQSSFDVDYDFILARAKDRDIEKNYTINPNNVIVKIPNIVEQGKDENSIGFLFLKNDSIDFIFSGFCTGSGITFRENNLEKTLRNYIKNEVETRCKLKDYLQKAGANIIYEVTEEVTPDIDLSINSLTKDSIISLLK